MFFHSSLDTINVAMEVDHEDDIDDSFENNSVTFEWSSEPKHPRHEDSKDIFVYHRALTIRPTLLMPMKPSGEGFVEESAAILYNLALAYHLYGLEERKPQFLHAALTLYELAFCLTKTRMHHLFDLAVLNNLGQIYHKILDFDKFLQCFVHLSEELQCVSRPMDACNYMGVLLNLLNFFRPYIIDFTAYSSQDVCEDSQL